MDYTKNVIFSTSYGEKGCDLITSLIKVYDPKYVIEIGSQQGASAAAITRGMSVGSIFVTCDLFEEQYDQPPYKETHAECGKVIDNLEWENPKCNWNVVKQNGLEVLDSHDNIDVLHVDICNYYDNLKPILELAADRVNDLILLEGGIHNDWQKKYNFQPYNTLLHGYFGSIWSHTTIKFNEHNALTICTKK